MSIDNTRNVLIAKVKACEDEAILKALCAILKGEAVAKPKSKVKVIKPATPTATKVNILEYKFKDHSRIGIQTNGKPPVSVLATLRELKEARLGNFYSNVSENPFGEGPFWSFKKDETVEKAVVAIQAAVA